ncbi:2'-5' RNA ligase family protein [Streptomyces sp. NPDC056347]|uniref:2'-5' RNA ligase family protein n=1 Tax=Streptomyces sp. NPDC056347 TaxID=3345790 RepID=UPI0035E223D4
MENFFERVAKAWPVGRRDLHWHILPAASEADELLASYPETVFSRPGLSRVPSEWLHCTLLHAVGLSAADVDVGALVRDARAHVQQMEPFTLTFDRPAIGPVAIEISGWPGTPFTRLVGSITQLTQEQHTAFQPAASRYPHMSIAYTGPGSETINPVDLREALASIEEPLSHTVRADRIHLVEQWHDGATIKWEPIASIPLKGSA